MNQQDCGSLRSTVMSEQSAVLEVVNNVAVARSNLMIAYLLCMGLKSWINGKAGIFLFDTGFPHIRGESELLVVQKRASAVTVDLSH